MPPPEVIRNSGQSNPPTSRPRARLPRYPRHQRLHTGVGHRRAQPVELPHLRRHLARQAHRKPRRLAFDGLAYRLLVGGVHVRVQQAHGDALDALRHQGVHGAMHAAVVQRVEHLPRRGDPLRDGRHPFSRDEGVGLLDVEVVLVVAPLTGDFEDVAESRGDDGPDGGAPALDQRVGRQRGPVDDRADVARRKPRPRQRQPGAVEDRAHRVVRGGEDLDGVAGAVVLHRHVGERAADVDGEPGACHRAASSSVPAARAIVSFPVGKGTGRILRRDEPVVKRTWATVRSDALQFRASSKYSPSSAEVGGFSTRRYGKSASPVARPARMAPRSRSLRTCRPRSAGVVQAPAPAPRSMVDGVRYSPAPLTDGISCT